MAAACSFRYIVRAPPPPRGLTRRSVRCCSAAPDGASISKLVMEVKERLEREHPGLPTGTSGRDDDEMILWFLKDRKFAVDEAVSKLTKAIKWRQDFRVSELSEESVKGLYQTGKAYVHSSFDIYGRPVLVVVAAKHFPSKQDPLENEKLCAFLVEKALSKLPMGTDNILGIFDLRGFRVENGDLQFLKFLIDVFYYYYPKRLGQVLFVDAPFVFQPMWQLVKPLLKQYASLRIVELLKFKDSNAQGWRFMTGHLAKDELMVAIYGAWNIWKKRCRRVFQQAFKTENQLMELLNDDSLLLGTYLREKSQGNERGMEPDSSE